MSGHSAASFLSRIDKQNYPGYLLREAPERVLQFGEKGFLRAFIESFIDGMNEKAGLNGKVDLVHSRGDTRRFPARFKIRTGFTH